MAAADKQGYDLDLGEMDSEEDFAFPPAERKVITQPIDLSVNPERAMDQSNFIAA